MGNSTKTRMKWLGMLIAASASLSAQPIEWDVFEPAGDHPMASINITAIGSHAGDVVVIGNTRNGQGGAVYLSSDQGDTWMVLSGGLPYLSNASPVFVNVDSENYLFASLGTLFMRSPDGLARIAIPGTDTSQFQYGKVLSGASGNGRIVLGGSRGTYSADPAWWVSDNGGQTFTYYEGESRVGDVSVLESIKGMAYGAGKFVAVGYPGEVWTSVDGVAWTQHPLPKAKQGSAEVERSLHTIFFRDGTFHAIGSSLSVMKSTDGINWDVVTESGGTTRALSSLLIDGNVWHAGGPDGGQAWSTDGGGTWQSWTGSTNDDVSQIVGGNGVVFADRYFAPAGGFIGYGNRIVYDWFTGGFPNVAYADGTWLVLHNGQYLRGAAAASLLDEATTTDGINYLHPWLGWFQKGANGWFFHYNLGWCYTEAKGDGAWVYNNGLGWLFLSSVQWPFFYHAPSAEWGYYTGSPDWFFNASRQLWQLRAEFGTEPWVVSKEWLYGKTIRMTDSTGSHTLVISGPETVVNTFSINGTTLENNYVTVFADISTPLEGPGRRIAFDFSAIAGPYIGSRVLFVLNFEGAHGGTYLFNYTILQGLTPVGESNIPGTFAVE